jgi:transposase-like protein
MASVRKSYSPSFKAKVALEAVRAEKTGNEIASQYGIHPTLLSQWKKQLIDESATLFSDNRLKDGLDHQELTARLYQQIGQLQVELDWLKKKGGRLP